MRLNGGAACWREGHRKLGLLGATVAFAFAAQQRSAKDKDT